MITLLLPRKSVLNIYMDDDPAILLINPHMDR